MLHGKSSQATKLKQNIFSYSSSGSTDGLCLEDDCRADRRTGSKEPAGLPFAPLLK